MHRTRRSAMQHIEYLASTGRWEEAYQRSVLWDFASEARMGLQLAFLRPFAVPRMANVLVRTGRITASPERRAYNTGVLIHEIIFGGIHGARSRQVISHINHAHRAPGVLQEDLSYVLCAFIVVPTRYIERTGWRPFLPAEREAALQFYQGLGRLMNIHDMPESYLAAEAQFDNYENRYVGPSPAGVTLGRDVIKVLQRRLPAPLRPLAGSLFASQIDDQRILDALAIDGGPRLARRAVVEALRLRSALTSQRPAPSKPVFTPGQPVGRIYPQGYQLNDLIRP